MLLPGQPIQNLPCLLLLICSLHEVVVAQAVLCLLYGSQSWYGGRTKIHVTAYDIKLLASGLDGTSTLSRKLWHF